MPKKNLSPSPMIAVLGEVFISGGDNAKNLNGQIKAKKLYGQMLKEESEDRARIEQKEKNDMQLEGRIFGDGDSISSKPRQNIETHELLRDTISEDEPSIPSIPISAAPSSNSTSQVEYKPAAKAGLATKILGALNSALDPFLGAEPPKTKPSRATVTRKPDKDLSR
jgi:hypothetical protein